jgi:ABC-2 type transport system permease protein
MKSIIIHEIKLFFGSTIGYMVVALFLVINGLFLFVFEGDYNILNSGFADLNPFFSLAPWVFLLLIPAVTMRSFSDEKKLGTLELLLTKPLSVWEIVTGKFFGAVFLIIICVLPSLIYIYAIDNVSMSNATLDMGSIYGSYFGLFFLVTAFCSIGIFTSTLSENQIVAFIGSVFICFLFFFGFEALGNIFSNFESFINLLGMQTHYKSISRGVIDSRDCLYFMSITLLFLSFTVFNLKSLKL